jgi:hypothetical protein
MNEYTLHLEYAGYNDDIMMLSVPELDDDAAIEAAWAEWCAEHPEMDEDGEAF